MHGAQLGAVSKLVAQHQLKQARVFWARTVLNFFVPSIRPLVALDLPSQRAEAGLVIKFLAVAARSTLIWRVAS
jgi:hypothetical protein